MKHDVRLHGVRLAPGVAWQSQPSGVALAHTRQAQPGQKSCKMLQFLVIILILHGCNMLKL